MTKEKSFNIYIHRTLKSIDAKLQISKSALEAVDSIIRVTATQLVNKSIALTRGSDKTTISDAHINASVSLILPQDLANSSTDFANESVEKFKATEQLREQKKAESKAEGNNEKKTAQTRESRAGLIFSVSAVEKYLRCFGQNAYHISSTSPVYLAAVLQYLTSALLELASSQTRENGKVTLNTRHVFLGAVNDQSIRAYVDSLGFVFLDAGVENHIEQKLLEKKPRKRLAPTADGSRRRHRWRPGTKTLLTMKRLQKTSDLLMQHAPFQRATREVGNSIHEDLRYSKEFMTSFQYFIEDRMISLMRNANKIALHAGRETVYARDVELARSLVEPDLQVAEKCNANIPEAAIRKMALRAGIKRYGDDGTDAYRSLFLSFLATYLYDITVCATLYKVQTLNSKLMIEALNLRNLYPSIVSKKRRGRKAGSTRSTSTAESVAESEAVSDVENEESEALATVAEE